MTTSEIINSYWNELLTRIQEYKYSTNIVRHIIQKCFNSEHPLNTIKIGRYKLFKIIIDAFNSYSSVVFINDYTCLSKLNLSLKEYPIPHQNALYESDKQYIYAYIHKSKELLLEIYNQHVFLKPYTDICELQYYCKKITKRMDRLLEAIDYVPIISDKLSSK